MKIDNEPFDLGMIAIYDDFAEWEGAYYEINTGQKFIEDGFMQCLVDAQELTKHLVNEMMNMIAKSFESKLMALWEVTDSKRVKAKEAGWTGLADELSSTQDYLEIAIGREFNFEWND